MSEAVTEVSTAPYTMQETIKLFAASFRYSRGDPDVQDQIFHFLCSKYRQRLDAEIIKDLIPAFSDLAGKFIYHSGIHPNPDIVGREDQTILEGIESEVAYQAKQFTDILQNDYHAEIASSDILLGWFARTLSNEAKRIPFNGTKNSHKRNLPLKYRSNIVDHGLLGRSTGIAEMDDYFISITGAYLKGATGIYTHRVSSTNLPAVVAAHLSYNSEDTGPLTAVVK